MTEDELQQLISLKRFEQPEDDYFDDFLAEFQERQRSEILKLSARSLFMERVKAWFDFSSGTNKLVLVTGAACVACTLVAMTMHFLPKIQQQQKMANHLDTLPTDVAETSSDALILRVDKSTQVSSELEQKHRQSIDFTESKADSGPVFSSDQIVY